MIDYKDLLKKYMCVIRSEEGIDYVDFISANISWSNIEFTEEEKKALEEISKSTKP